MFTHCLHLVYAIPYSRREVKCRKIFLPFFFFQFSIFNTNKIQCKRKRHCNQWVFIPFRDNENFHRKASNPIFMCKFKRKSLPSFCKRKYMEYLIYFQWSSNQFRTCDSLVCQRSNWVRPTWVSRSQWVCRNCDLNLYSVVTVISEWRIVTRHYSSVWTDKPFSVFSNE